ncbi:hypothetical protein NIES2119_31370 [[Phormidium ambiguum] IAM M-71]|uniref:Uncharacterized protein n=1 Tax=[Phormidium ambiguum] IAM M-71 TaxID=454136 RepID=A0A1U7I2G7_9CYAN|nr:hypothetical protein NIES2119_31370 [Phormidium ambiguum IAM M-71]
MPLPFAACIVSPQGVAAISKAYSGFSCQGSGVLRWGACIVASLQPSTTVALPLIHCQEGSSKVKMSLAYGSGQGLADLLMGLAGGRWWALVGLLGAGGAARGWWGC